MPVSSKAPPLVSTDAIRVQVEKIAASDGFAGSANSIKFLRYIVNEELEGRGETLKEVLLGIEVFEIPGFDPRTDGRVRKEAGRLRERLEHYYSGPGLHDAIRVQVPKGGYRPMFEELPRRPRTVMSRWVSVCAAVLGIFGASLLVPGTWRWIAERFPASKRDIPAEKHIVVLPFTSVDSKPASEEFRLGLLFTLAARLSQGERFEKSFWVAQPSDVLATGITSAAPACHAFGANLVVTGSIESGGGKTRLTGYLIRCVGSSYNRVGSFMIDSELGNSFVLQDEVWRKLVDILDLPRDLRAERAVSSGGTTQPRAEDFYIQARGYLLQGVEGVDNAIDLFLRAIESDSAYALAHAGLGEAYLQKYGLAKDSRWIDMARASCRDAIRINAQLAPVYVTQGLIFHTTGQYEQALEEYRKALEIDPRSAEAYSGLASAYDRMDDAKEAEQTYKTAIAQRSGYWGSYKDLGVFYYRRGRYADAEQAFLWGKKLAPDNAQLYFDLGGLYLQMGRYAQAEEMLKESLSRKPNAVAYSNLSAVFFYQRRYADAIDPMKKAVALDHTDVALLGNLARTYRWVPARKAESAETYRQAIRKAKQQLEINPRDSELRAELALMLAESADRANALIEIRRARAQSPTNVNVLFRAVLAYEIAGERTAALDALAAIVQNGTVMEEIRRRPELDGLRSEPRYSALVGAGNDLRPGEQNPKKTQGGR